jgi:hypothetical protein
VTPKPHVGFCAKRSFCTVVHCILAETACCIAALRMQLFWIHGIANEMSKARAGESVFERFVKRATASYSSRSRCAALIDAKQISKNSYCLLVALFMSRLTLEIHWRT